MHISLNQLVLQQDEAEVLSREQQLSTLQLMKFVGAHLPRLDAKGK